MIAMATRQTPAGPKFGIATHLILAGDADAINL